MSEEIKGQVQVAEGQQPETMPVSTKPEEVSSEPNATGSLPDEVSERTKQEFEKLKEHNRILAQELERVKQPQVPKTSVFDQFKPQVINPVLDSNVLNQKQGDAIDKSFVDADGYVDPVLLNNVLTQAEKRAEKAEEVARQAQLAVQNFEITNTQKTVFGQYPELDPNNEKFDPVFNERVRNQIIGQLMSGHKEDFLAAANQVFQLFPKTAEVETAQKQAVQEYKETVSKKEQINATSSSIPSEDRNELIRRTQMGDSSALDARLKALGIL